MASQAGQQQVSSHRTYPKAHFPCHSHCIHSCKEPSTDSKISPHPENDHIRVLGNKCCRENGVLDRHNSKPSPRTLPLQPRLAMVKRSFLQCLWEEAGILMPLTQRFAAGQLQLIHRLARSRCSYCRCLRGGGKGNRRNADDDSLDDWFYSSPVEILPSHRPLVAFSLSSSSSLHFCIFSRAKNEVDNIVILYIFHST